MRHGAMGHNSLMANAAKSHHPLLGDENRCKSASDRRARTAVTQGQEGERVEDGDTERDPAQVLTWVGESTGAYGCCQTKVTVNPCGNGPEVPTAPLGEDRAPHTLPGPPCTLGFWGDPGGQAPAGGAASLPLQPQVMHLLQHRGSQGGGAPAVPVRE